MSRAGESVADRLRSFGQSKFGNDYGWKSRFAAELGISAQHLERYLSGSAEPGKKMYLRLITLGCDIRWLLTGAVSGIGPAAPASKRDRDLLEALRKAGIHTVEQINYILDPERIAADVAEAASKEIKTRYKTSLAHPHRRK